MSSCAKLRDAAAACSPATSLVISSIVLEMIVKVTNRAPDVCGRNYVGGMQVRTRSFEFPDGYIQRMFVITFNLEQVRKLVVKTISYQII